MPIQAWIDDSGVKGSGTYITLAGLMGEAFEWSSFTDRWEDVLSTPPRITKLSTSDAATLGEEFSRFKPWERDSKLRKLASVINAFPFTIVDCSIELAGFEAVIPKLQARKKGPEIKRLNTFSQQPYFMALHTICTVVCLEMMDRRVRDRCDITFDEQEIMKPRVTEWYPHYLKALTPLETRYMPNLPRFEDDDICKPLQAADMIAWLVRAKNEGDLRLGWVWSELKNLRRSRWSIKYDDSLLRQMWSGLWPPADEQQRRYVEILRPYLGLDD